MEVNPYKLQARSIHLAKNYLNSKKKEGIDINLSPFCDFYIFAECLGREKLSLLSKRKFISFKLIFLFLKQLLFIRNNIHIFGKIKKIKKKKKINIIYSYCEKNNFKNDGTFYDNIFNCRSSQNNTYWFLISLDNYIPPKLKNNILIVYTKKNFLDFLYLFIYISKNFFKKNLFHVCTKNFNYAKIIEKLFYESFKGQNFNLYMPFENLAHQHSVITSSKKISKKNLIFGYLYPMPWPFQVDMIFKNRLLDKLLVCSNFQKNVLVNNFFWPQKKIKIISSLRYSKLKKRYNNIFVPYDLTNNQKKNYIDSIKKLVFKLEIIKKNYTVSLHPLRKRNKKYIHFKERILKIVNKGKMSKSKNLTPIVLGSPGSVTAECLQSIGKVIHVPGSFFDYFSKTIWKNIGIKNITDNIYEYKIKKRIKFTVINNAKFNFKKILMGKFQ